MSFPAFPSHLIHHLELLHFSNLTYRFNEIHLLTFPFVRVNLFPASLFFSISSITIDQKPESNGLSSIISPTWQLFAIY